MPAADDFKMGDFSKSIVPDAAMPATAPRVSPEPVAAAVAALETEARVAEDELKPMRTYEDQLREAGVTRERAAEIVDAIMRRGFWSEEISITKSVKARFRTRHSRDRSRTMAYIESVRPLYDAHYQELMNKQLLAASLEAFADDKFEHPNPRTAKAEDVDQAFDIRFRYVDGGMADPALNLLLRHFLKFEEKIRAVTQEGVVENF